MLLAEVVDYSVEPPEEEADANTTAAVCGIIAVVAEHIVHLGLNLGLIHDHHGNRNHFYCWDNLSIGEDRHGYGNS